MNTQLNANDLRQKITHYLEELAEETDMARKSEAMLQYLNFVAKFHQYSPSNIWLILIAKPDATNVAGFHTWKKLGRYVKKGERGIPIFAPLVYQNDPLDKDSPKVLNGFKIVYVFDFSQTEGKPLPPMPSWKSPAKNKELNEKLILFAKNRGIEVLIKKQRGETQGVSMGGLIEIDPAAGTKTLIHEISHELLHHGKNGLTHAEKEMEAEATAYIVCKNFGMNDLASPNYLVFNKVDGKSLVLSLGRIQTTAEEIIEAIESAPPIIGGK